MTKVPSLDYHRVVAALERSGWKVIRQRGSHIRMECVAPGETLRITVPAHRPIKRSTLAHLLKQAKLTVDEFLIFVR